MKDLIKRCLIGLITGAFLGYMGELYFQGVSMTQGWISIYAGRYLLIIVLIFVFLFIFFAVYPVHFKMNKATLFLVGLSLLVMGDTIFLNAVEQHVYVGDLLKLFGVVLMLLAWTNVLITDKVQKQGKGKKVEIIEV